MHMTHMSKNNTAKPWGQIREVEMDEIPKPRYDKYSELVKELDLRLERTVGGRGLVIPFAEKRNAASLAGVLRQIYKRRGACLSVALRQNAGAWEVYVWSYEREPPADKLQRTKKVHSDVGTPVAEAFAPGDNGDEH